MDRKQIIVQQQAPALPELVFLNDATLSTKNKKHLLLLSVGYGQGHHSAAAALAEYYEESGWSVRVEDVCKLAQPRLFRCTQKFYDFCVRQAPWLWGVTYKLTDTADWAHMVRQPALHGVLVCLRSLLSEFTPDLIICTYPLFAYVLDALKADGEAVPPYVVVVTDALEISRPWLKSNAPLVILPDEKSCMMVRERYALASQQAVAAGFPVRRAFGVSKTRKCPDTSVLSVLYGAYRQTGGVIKDVSALLYAFPQMQLTVIAGRRAALLRKRFATYLSTGRLEVIEKTNRMPELLAESHFYIGKAGAATMFECYAANVPMLINFTLPGQEQGNLELLLQDGAGCHVESTAHLVATMQKLLANDAAGWAGVCRAMLAAGRVGAARNIARVITENFGL